MAEKLTLEIIKAKVEKRVAEINLREDRDISFLGILGNELKGNQTKLILKCNIHNVIWTTTSYNNFMKPGFTGGCKMCKSGSITKASKFTPEEALQKVENFRRGSRFNYDFSSIKDTYKEFHQKVTVVCPKHGPFGVVYCNLLLHKNSGMCPECRKEELSERLSTKYEDIVRRVTKRIDQIKSEFGVELEFLGIRKRKGNTRPLGQYLILRCKTHNITWDTTSISNFINGITIIGCPICNAQFLHEVKVWEILKGMTQEGDLIRHHKLEIEGKLVIPDFYIKSMGIMIEYDGKQHYEYIPHFHKDSYQGLINQVNRDKALEQYCLENGIKLLRIPYKDDNRLGEVIKAFLRDGKDITTKVEPKLLPAIIYG